MAETTEKSKESASDIDIKEWKESKENPWDTVMEKVIFVYSTFNFGVSCFFIGSDAYCWWLPVYYCIKFPLLMIARYFVYHSRSWHWFMLEFCYASNMLLFLFLWYFYDNLYWFIVVFIISNGPLLHSVAALGNSLVFHSLDKTTSLLIHITPATITYVIKWKLHDPFRIQRFSSYLIFNDINNNNNNNNSTTMYYGNDIVDSFESTFRKDRWYFENFNQNIKSIVNNNEEFYQYFVYYPMYFVITHQIIYYLLTNWIFYYQIINDPNAMTSYRFFFRKKEGFAYSLLGICGPHCRIFVFGFYFVCCAILTFIPAYYMWTSEKFHLCYIIFIALCGVYNGASFYAHAYQKKQRSHIKKS